MHATREIQESLTGAVDEGMKMLQSFVNGTLTEGNNRDFYGPITRSKLKTFEDLTKTRGSQEPVIAHLDQSCFQ